MSRERLLAPSRIMRSTPRQTGGGRHRAALVKRAGASIRKGSKSFAFASRLFDRQTRERTWLLYAWCRRCDDIADGQDHGGELRLDKSDPKDRVEAIRVLTRRALEGQPTADIAFDAFGQVAMEAGLTLDMAEDVLEGFALDAAGWRPRNEHDLMRYCFHVAGAVGVMMAIVMGVDRNDEETLDRACDLGLAFQLANIARDIGEDSAAGRCYLPMEWLAEEGIPPGEHMKPPFRQALARMAARLVELSRIHELAAREGAMRLSFRQRWAVLSAAGIYGAIATGVEQAGEQAWDGRVHTSGWAKTGFVIRGLWQALAAHAPAQVPPRWSRRDLAVERTAP